ncbi:MAG: F0F1 ATP synthase subunit delta [Breznakia sp.]
MSKVNNLVAKRYAEAFFEVALEEAKMDIFKKDLQDINDVLHQAPEVMHVIKHPETTKVEKKQLFQKLFQDCDALTMNFLYVLVDEERARYVAEIYDCFLKFMYEHQGIEIAYVYSAAPLYDPEKQDIQKMLEKKRNKEIICQYIVKKELIAGIRIQIKDDIMDHSILAQLQNLKRNVDRAIL